MTIGIFLVIALVLLRWTYKVIKNAPIGYEDEYGFHELVDTPNVHGSKKIAA